MSHIAWQTWMGVRNRVRRTDRRAGLQGANCLAHVLMGGCVVVWWSPDENGRVDTRGGRKDENVKYPNIQVFQRPRSLVLSKSRPWQTEPYPFSRMPSGRILVVGPKRVNQYRKHITIRTCEIIPSLRGYITSARVGRSRYSDLRDNLC